MSRRNHIESAMRNHGLVLFLFSALTIFGIWALGKMNKDEFPFFTIRQGVVVAVYPGATAQEVEQQVTIPLEAYINGFEEVDKAHTYSVSEDGMVYVYVMLKQSVTSNNEAWTRIRANLDLFRKTSLPTGVLATMLIDDFGNTSSLLLAVESPSRTPRELSHYTTVLSDRLRQIPEMGKIKVYGERSEEIAVTIDPALLSSYGVDYHLIQSQLLLQGLRTMSATSSGTQFQVSIPYASEHAIAQQIIWSDPLTGAVLRLKDVARIERRYAEPTKYVDFYPALSSSRSCENSSDSSSAKAPCLIVSVEMTAGNNIVQFGRDVDAALADARRLLPPDLTIHRITDQPRVVESSVSSFLHDIIVAILVVIAVMLVLFPLRTALVASTGVPICIAIGLGLMYLMGIELNTVTLAALIFVLGMIVDDSVIIIDGYTHLLDKGHSAWYSACQSTKQLFVPMSLATCAISGMFFPMTRIITGPLGEFIQLFPFAISFALIASIFYASYVTPYLATRYIRRSRSAQLSRFEQAQMRFFAFLEKGYAKVLSFCFRSPKWVYVLLFASLAIGGGLLSILHIQLLPKAERECFAVEIHLQEGETLEQTALVADSLARILQRDSLVRSVTSFVGQGSPRFHAIYQPNMARPNYAQFIVHTVSCDATEQLLRAYAPRYEHYFPNAYVRFKQVDYQASQYPIEVRFQGQDLDQLSLLADSLRSFMAQDEDLTWVHSSYDGFSRQVRIVLREDEATRLGITQTSLSLYLSSLYSGSKLTTLYEDDYALPVTLYMDSQDGDLGDVLIPTHLSSVWVPLRQVADLEPAWHRARITHYNAIPTITVACDLRGNTSAVVVEKRIQNWLDTYMPTLPDGVEVSFGGLSALNAEMVPQILWSVAAALLVMLLLLLYHFGRVSLSLLTLSSALLCLFGASLGLYLFGMDISMTAFLGLVALIGVIVRNAIMMYEYAEELRQKQHLSARQAAYEAGLRRMRPIFLTSATTALGVVPMILAQTSLWMPMGVVICFGTIFTLPLTVTILPILYWKLMCRHDRPTSPTSPAATSSCADIYVDSQEDSTPSCATTSTSTQTYSPASAMRKSVLPIALLLFLALPVSAQSTPLTLDSCLQLAKKNNLELQHARFEIQKAQEVKAAATTHFFPQVSASAMGYYALDPMLSIGIDDLPNAQVRDLLHSLYTEYGATLGLNNPYTFLQYGYSASLTAVQPIFVGGKVVNGNRLAQVGVEAATLQADVKERDILTDVEQSYWLVLGLQDKEQTLTLSETLLDTLYHMVCASVQAGLALQTDLLEVEIKRQELRRLRLQLTNGLALARRALGVAIGVDASDIVVLGAEHVLADSLSALPTIVFSENRSAPEYELLSLQIEAESLRKKMTLADAMPQLAVGASYAYGRLQNNLLKSDFGNDKGNAMVFATLRVPLTDWWKTAHQLREHDLTIAQAYVEQQRLTQMLDLRSLQAYDQYKESLLSYQEQKRLCQLRAQHYDCSLANYTAGRITLPELLQSQTALLQSRNALTDAYIAACVARRRYVSYTPSEK